MSKSVLPTFAGFDLLDSADLSEVEVSCAAGAAELWRRRLMDFNSGIVALAGGGQSVGVSIFAADPALRGVDLFLAAMFSSTWKKW